MNPALRHASTKRDGTFSGRAGVWGSYDSLWTVSATLSHSASTLTLLGGSTLHQDAGDESFGLDDAYVWIR